MNAKLSKTLNKHGHFKLAEHAEELETLWVYWKQHSDEAQAEVHRLSLVIEQQNDTIDKLLSLAYKLTNAQQSIDAAQDCIKEVKLQRQSRIARRITC